MERINSTNVRDRVVNATTEAIVDIFNQYDPEDLEDEAVVAVGAKIANLTADKLAPFLRPVLDERDAYREMIKQLLKSAHPNPRDHPNMTVAWNAAAALLGEDSPW